MCGIIGIAGKDSRKHQERARAMMSCLSHRGPDGDGITSTYDDCILGHRRLAIVDLAGGAQPMYSQQGAIAIVFNGEIYGFKKIKENLEQQYGYSFHTQSDTEVILALYETHGSEKFLEKLPGMFALAIWNEHTKTLVAARDRFGEKPFYYAFGKNGEFIFASEIKAIIASGLITPEISHESIAHYLKKLYIHPTQTIYKNVHTLPPAHMLTLTHGNATVSRYWNMPATNESISMDEALPEFKRLLTEAVEKQLVADVPVGAFLSGGLDSTTIVALASKLTSKLNTFSFGFEGSKNELSFARLAAEAYGTNHRELEDRNYNIADLMLLMADIYDEPFADSSNIPTYLISKQTRQHATVVLSGDAGDELLGGYGWYKSLLNMSHESSLSIPGKTLFMRGLAQIAMRRNWKNKTRIISEARGLHYRSKYDSVIEAHRTSNVYFKDEEIAGLGIQSRATSGVPSWKLGNTVDDAMRDDIEDYMPGDILVKTDRASMASSLELRAPFLDVPFAEFAISLPHRLKVNTDEDKIIMRRAFEEMWPEAIRKRGKQGFGGPVTIWLNKPEVQALIEEYLNDPQKKIFGLLSFEKTRKYVAAKNYRTWILLTLSLWMEKH